MSKLKKILPQIVIVVVLIAAWQAVYMLGIFKELVFPSVPAILAALVNGLLEADLGLSVLYSLSFIVRGLLVGAVLAMVLSALSMSIKAVHQVYYLFISLFDPLPGIALLPLAILWFGTGEATIIFLIVHSVIWPLSRSILDGFSTVPQIYVETGRNYGLKRLRLVGAVFVPASMPNLLSGVKTGWARAWRALISAEMIFGVSGSVGGIGWYIFTSRYKLDTPSVYASLLVIILIGLVVEYGIFGVIERNTVKKWGVTR